MILAAVGVLLAFLGKPAYRRYKEERAASRAEAFMVKGDFRNASLSARQALLLNTNNLAAVKVMAALAEASRSPLVLDWRRRVLDLEPSTENRLHLAAAGLRVQRPPFPLTAEMLKELAPAASNTPNFQVLSAELALKTKRQDLAATHFEIASRLEPTNRLHRLNLAVLRLGSTDPATANAARVELVALKSDPALAAVALRWLVGDFAQKGELKTAEQLSRDLLVTRGCIFEDRLELLTTLDQARSPLLDKEIDLARQVARTNASSAYSLSAWFISHERAAEAIKWLTNLPPALMKEQPVPLARVDAYSALKDWSGLARFLTGEKWGELDFLRFAFLSRVAAERGEPIAVESEWRKAVLSAGDRLGSLASLLNLAGIWNRPAAREQMLWLIAERFPRETWAFRELDVIYTRAADTRGLNRLYSALMKRDSNDLVARNNFAATSLLLGNNVAQAHEIAKEIYQAKPGDPIIVSTYAFSLLMQNRATNALAVMDGLSEAQLDQPTVALYYGLVLRKTGQTKKAAASMERARRATNLLPEEQALLNTR
jgi:predicted Zn-dependent protease